MKIVFLDIDGVLNHAGWLVNRMRHEDLAMRYAFHAKEDMLRSACGLDPACIEQLNFIYEETGARFVLSSTWRKDHTVIQMNRLLRYYGFESYLVGTTHSLVKKPEKTEHGLWVSAGRGREIELWLKTMNFYEPTRIAILDDDGDMTPYMDHLVQTDWEVGLNRERAEAAIAMLREGPAI